jgi:hypothetical protein
MARLNQLVILASALAAGGLGCSQSEYIEVTGTVSWKGAPVEVGEIIFAPTDKAITPAAGRIRDGDYKVLAKPGKARVEIQAVRKTGRRDPQEGFEITELFIPRRYNEESQLEAEVTEDGENEFNFNLTE